jgi:hypothetical protein
VDKRAISDHLGVEPSGRDDILSLTWALPRGIFVSWTDPKRLSGPPPYWWGEAGVFRVSYRPSPSAIPSLIGETKDLNQLDELIQKGASHV